MMHITLFWPLVSNFIIIRVGFKFLLVLLKDL